MSNAIELQTPEWVLQEPETGPATVLLAGDSEDTRHLLGALLRERGYRVIIANDGREAVVAFECFSPDLILMEISMPVMDGLEATRLIKQRAGDTYVPVVFVVAASDATRLEAGMQAGGDDFLFSPFNGVVLEARISALLRIRGLYREQHQQRLKLAYYQDRTRQEQEVAEKLFSSIVHKRFLDSENIRYQLSPMSVFNGDVLLAARSPNGRTHLFAGDFTGHGLSASIGALPTSEIFYAMTAKGFGVEEILVEINRRLHSILPTGMFLAATAIDISEDVSMARVWSGGAPDLLLRRRGGSEVVRVKARHFPLGIVDSSDLDTEVEVLALASGDRLYIYTDGVTEMVNPENEQFGMDRLSETVANCHEDSEVFETLLTELDLFRAGQAQEDDVTLIEYLCRDRIAGALQAPEAEPEQTTLESATWQAELAFEADVLRRMDPLPVVLQLIMEVQGLRAHREKLYTILAELFNNALEHGLLNLESAIKSTPEGFNEYYQLRQRRLSDLQTGCIAIALDHQPTDQGGRLGIQISDSGRGFDPVGGNGALAEGNQFSGRGITLVRSLCEELEYSPSGNRVRAVYAWAN